MVDQFGYPTDARKVAVVPVSALTDTTFELRESATGIVLGTYQATPWRDGAVHEQSASPALVIDFSAYNRPGDVVLTSTEWSSHPFRIADDVYAPVLDAAVHMFYYQRSGIEKNAAYTRGSWTQPADYTGPGQDTQARSIDAPDDASTALDLSGGWWDAGNTNKYVTFASSAVHQLLSAHSSNPGIWGDDAGIPESGNGAPDLLDEVVYELQWLRRMQQADGGVLNKVGTTDDSFSGLPADDTRPRFYGLVCSSSTIAAAGMYAHAAVVLADVDVHRSLATNLQVRAEQAWQHYRSNPRSADCDDGRIASGDADRTLAEQDAEAVAAAAWLFRLTDKAEYRDFVEANWLDTRMGTGAAWGLYDAHHGDALVDMVLNPSSPEPLVLAIRDRMDEMMAYDLGLFGRSEHDPYGAHMPNEQYHWGSNQVKANIGTMNLDVRRVELSDDREYRDRAAASLHYLHGVNPLGLVYLTNMTELGAEQSATELYHQWFQNEPYVSSITSTVGPPAGYVVGGANHSYSGPLTLPGPYQLAYVDTGRAEDVAWELSEPGIDYQAAYIRLLSEFVPE